jgi:hypothetical protein
MKNLFTAMLLATAFCSTLSFSAHAETIPTQAIQEILELDNSTLMRLLHIIKKDFNWSMNHTKHLYDTGEVTITLVDVNGTPYYMIGYAAEGYCILAALEDNL